mgnify:CR=1 FL=1
MTTTDKKINILTGDYDDSLLDDESIREQFKKYPFEPDHFQKHAIERINKNEHVLICVPTGSGKTLVAMEGIFRALSQGKKVIYTSPIKTLSNQKFSEFKKIFPDTSVGILTGDIKLEPNADILIMTTEILRNLLYYNKMGDDSLAKDRLGCDVNIEKEVAVIIYDEVHYINNKERGKVWEESIIMAPKDIQLVMLSATIHRPDIFASWIQSISKLQVNLIRYTKRPVPLEHYAFLNIGKITTKDKRLIDKFNGFKNKLVPILTKDCKYLHKNVTDIKSIYDEYLRSIRRRYVPAKAIFVPLVNMLNEKN